MSRQAKRRNASRSSRRLQKASGSLGRFQLRRLPDDYCWQLLKLLLESCSQELSASFVSTLHGIIRRRDVEAYYRLDAQWGLQCISSWVNPMQGNPAVVHMLVSSFRKCKNLALFTPKQRKEVCITNVVRIDDAIPSLRSEWLTDEVYVHARRWLAELLGCCPTSDEVHYCSRHGPGSTSSIPYYLRSVYFKHLRWPYRSTPSARGLLTHCIRADLRWRSVVETAVRAELKIDPWNIVIPELFDEFVVDASYPYNTITTVPKDGRKDRPIAKEQTGNIYLQLGVGQIIRTRLRAFGVDLNHQADINRELALSASADRRFFTIDLSNASDTVGYDLVKALLPSSWFSLLDSLRAPWGVLPNGQALLYKKFSSMGNGFTFELETIVFLSILMGIRRCFGDRSDRFFAFGDDIIGPDYLYNHCLHYLSFSGFLVNSEKSFHGAARVRESCGVDALDGRNIRPFFVKSTPECYMEGVGLRNRIRSWYLRHLGEYPSYLDDFLIGRTFKDCPPIGPDSNVEFDGWLQDGPLAEGVRFQALVPKPAEVPAKDFGSRKLMHELRSCTGDGGNFIVSEESKRVELVDRVVESRFDWLVD